MITYCHSPGSQSWETLKISLTAYSRGGRKLGEGSKSRKEQHIENNKKWKVKKLKKYESGKRREEGTARSEVEKVKLQKEHRSFKKLKNRLHGIFPWKANFSCNMAAAKFTYNPLFPLLKAAQDFSAEQPKLKFERQIKIDWECWVSTRVWPCHPCPFPFHEGIGMSIAVVIPGGKVRPPSLKSQPLASELQPKPGCSTDWSTGSAWHPSTWFLFFLAQTKARWGCSVISLSGLPLASTYLLELSWLLLP